MPTLIMNVQLPKESELLLLELSHTPLAVPLAIKRGMDTALQLIVGKIKANRLSGTGPYPVSDHGWERAVDFCNVPLAPSQQ